MRLGACAVALLLLLLCARPFSLRLLLSIRRLTTSARPVLPLRAWPVLLSLLLLTLALLRFAGLAGCSLLLAGRHARRSRLTLLLHLLAGCALARALACGASLLLARRLLPGTLTRGASLPLTGRHVGRSRLTLLLHLLAGRSFPGALRRGESGRCQDRSRRSCD